MLKSGVPQIFASQKIGVASLLQGIYKNKVELKYLSECRKFS